MSKAHELAEQQRHYDRLHHLMRLEWLSGENPTWSDGVPVCKSEKLQMTQRSGEAVINPYATTRCVDLDDAEYIAELDAFGAKLKQAA